MIKMCKYPVTIKVKGIINLWKEGELVTGTEAPGEFIKLYWLGSTGCLFPFNNLLR